MRTWTLKALAIGACTALAASPGLAQSNTGGAGGPGTADAHWNVAWSPTGTGGGTSSGSGAAIEVSSPPGPWANTSPNSFWVSSNSTASLPNGSGDNVERYAYTFSQGWNSMSDYDLTMTVWTDNFFHSFTLNGNTTTVSPLAPSPGDFAQPQPRTFTIHVASGANTLSLYTTGDGTTDAVNVGFSSVPEPSSLALLGTGLVGLVPMVRRRRH